MVVLRIFCNILVFPDRFFLFIVVTNMSSFTTNLCSPPGHGNQTRASRPPAPTPSTQQQQREPPIEGSSAAKGKKVANEKRNLFAPDFDLESGLHLNSFIVAS